MRSEIQPSLLSLYFILEAGTSQAEKKKAGPALREVNSLQNCKVQLCFILEFMN